MSDPIHHAAPATPYGATPEEVGTFDVNTTHMAIVPPIQTGPRIGTLAGQGNYGPGQPGGGMPPQLPPGPVIPAVPVQPAAALPPLTIAVPHRVRQAVNPRQILLWQIIATHGRDHPVTARQMLELIRHYRAQHPELVGVYEAEGALLTGLKPLRDAGLIGHEYVNYEHRYWLL